jgi:hypothetical protein
MHQATQEILARSHAVANPRRMGYTDARPNIMPTSRLGGAHADHAGERSMFSGKGLEGRASANFASQLRPALYTPTKLEAPGKTGAELARAWGSPGVAPSQTVSGYAYRHAAAVSQWAGAGNVYDRLTDPRGFTGLHRHRFDVDGRGLGLAGRDGAGTDIAWINDSMPKDNSTPWYLSDPQLSGYGRPVGMGRVTGSGHGSF